MRPIIEDAVFGRVTVCPENDWPPVTDTSENPNLLGVPPWASDLAIGGGEGTRTLGLYIANVWFSVF